MISDLLMHSSNVEVQGRFLRGGIATLGTLIVPYLVMDSCHVSFEIACIRALIRAQFTLSLSTFVKFSDFVM